MRFAYYPGCSLHGTAKEYDVSIRAVCEELGIELEEVPDWTCCGASSAHSLSQSLATLLPARNLKQIESQNLDAIIPCAACFCGTKTCAYNLSNDNDLRERTERELEYSFRLDTRLYHLMELLIEKVGLEEIEKHVVSSLEGLRVVCYYGCLLVRPHEITQLDDRENPQFLDQLMTRVGATTIDWPFKTECCGAGLSLSQGVLVQKLIANMIGYAQELDAHAIVTACPLCQANLETRQGADQNMPVFYFTELLGLSFGLKKVESWLKKHLVDVAPAMEIIKHSEV